MTNEQYRRRRGTDHEFATTEAEAKEIWFAMNHEAILAQRKRKRRINRFRHRGDTPWRDFDIGDQT